jgi:Carboxypeptidase regulatory-like domain/TonB dependent receptor-like, beta-barrel/TonB-dependent Receptor Plug Domain
MTIRQEFVRRLVKHALIALIAFVFALPTQLSAQVVGATVSGTISDPSGAVTPGVNVSIKNVDTGVVSSGVTNNVGLYNIPNLTPGNYELTASARGFVTLVRSGIILTVGQELVLNLSLTVGGATQKVTVTGEAPTVNLANATMGGVNNSLTVQQLPLNGRSWTDLAALQPGVHFVNDQAPVGSGDRVKRGFGAELTISGGRPQQNNYMLDGININDYANAGPGSVLGGNLGTDAVAEFSVLTTNYSTEYGRTSGGVISAVTKSGTNQFHGSAYEFLRNDALDAANFFDNASGSAKAPLRRNQFGGSAGGPIQKDKTFIFGDYEQVKQFLGTTQTNTVPTSAARQGILVNGTPLTGACPFAGSTNLAPGKASVCVDDSVAKFLNAFIPLPNQPLTPGSDSGNYSFLSSQNTGEHFFLVRADHVFSEKDRISVTNMYDGWTQGQDDEYRNKIVQNPGVREVVALEENHIISPQLLNSFRAGYNRDGVASPSNATAVNPAVSDPAFGFIPGLTAGALDPLPELNAGFTGGLSTQAPFRFAWNSWQAYDNLFYTTGRHSIKIGANIERIESNTFGADFPGGLFHFNTLSDLLTNQPNSIVADTPGFVTPRGVRQTIVGAYIQDDFHARPNLTVNLGLRYEPSSVITEVQGKLSNLRVLNNLPPMPHTGDPYFLNPTKRNFEPRVGFAWDPFKNGKTAVRGGFGVFDMLPLPAEMGSGIDGSFPFDRSVAGTALPQGTFPTGAFARVTSEAIHRYYITEFKPKRNYILQWNFSIQRQLTPNTTFTVGYVGARGLHSRLQSDDVNMVMPTINAQGFYQWPCLTPLVPITAPGVGYAVNTCNDLPAYTLPTPPLINQYMRRTQMSTFNGYYDYNGLQFQVNKTMSRGLQVGGSYTYAKNIDIGTGSIASDPYRNSIDNLLWFCGPCRRSLTDDDIRNNFTANYVWDIPTPASFGTPAKAILGGWEAGGILTIQSGTPFTPQVTGDPLGMGTTTTHQYPDRVVGPGCTSDINPGNPNNYIKIGCFVAPNVSTRFGNAGRNTLIGPGLATFDFSMSKNIAVTRISEGFKMQIRADAFNLFNRANFESPWQNATILNPDGTVVPSAGAIAGTNTPSREMQLSVKLTW